MKTTGSVEKLRNKCKDILVSNEDKPTKTKGTLLTKQDKANSKKSSRCKTTCEKFKEMDMELQQSSSDKNKGKFFVNHIR